MTAGLPVYNGMATVHRSLDSLLAQDYEALEIVVSDNASTDGTQDLLRSHADPRVRVLEQPRNLGAATNFQTVLDEARGEFFFWTAADDFWTPSFVSKLVAALRHAPEADVAMCAVERIRSDSVPVDVVHFTGRADPSALSSWRLAYRMASGEPYHLFVYGLYRTAFLRRIFTGFPTGYVGDRLFMCRVALSTRFAYVDEVLHVRTAHVEPFARRYAGEVLAAAYADPMRWVKSAGVAGPYLLGTPGASWRQRLASVLVAGRFAALMLQGNLFHLAHPVASRVLPTSVRSAIRKAVRRP